MVFPQVIAVINAVLDAIGLPGNLLVILTIALERRFHMMRYILLASLAVSDFLFLIFVNSFRIASIANERWLYGETMCHLNPFFARYFYINTVNHLIWISFDRYHAIVKSPLTYSSTMTRLKILVVVMIWVSPFPFVINEFVGYGEFVYNPELFFCEDGWEVPTGFSAWQSAFFVVIGLFIPFAVIMFLNWSVYKKAKLQVHAMEVQLRSLDSAGTQQQEISRQRSERKAAFDVSIIIAAFLICFLPGWIVGVCRRFATGIKVPSEIVLITSSIFVASALCNPIIYSVRKRDFRMGAWTVVRKIVVFRGSHGVA